MLETLKGNSGSRGSGHHRREKIYIFSAVILVFAALTAGYFLHQGVSVSQVLAGRSSALERPIEYLSLPPIVVPLPSEANGRLRLITVAAALEFAADSNKGAIKGVRTGKIMLPFIMDSIITGIRMLNPLSAQNETVLTAFVLKRSNRVLLPHGVEATGLRVDDFHVR